MTVSWPSFLAAATSSSGGAASAGAAPKASAMAAMDANNFMRCCSVTLLMTLPLGDYAFTHSRAHGAVAPAYDKDMSGRAAGR